MKKLVIVLLLVFSSFSNIITVSAADNFSSPASFSVHKEFENACSASQHIHNFSWAFGESDVCNSCYYERLHKTNIELPFLIYRDHTFARSEPRQTSSVTRELSGDEVISIVARIRNEKNNVWCKTSDGDYIYVDNLVFDFDRMIVLSYELSRAHLGLDSAEAISSMYELFEPGGILDFKSVNMLGASRNLYKTHVKGRIVGSYTGEEIGNFVYGFNAAALGFDEELAIKAGGVGVVISDWHFIKAVQCLASGIGCDSEDDKENIIKGMKYYHYGQW